MLIHHSHKLELRIETRFKVDDPLFGENYDPFNGHDYSTEILTSAAVSRDAPLTDSSILLVAHLVAPCIPLNTKHKEIPLKNLFHRGNKLSITSK